MSSSQSYTIAPGETLYIGSQVLPPHAIMRATLNYSFPDTPIAGLKLEGSAVNGAPIFSLTLMNARTSVKCPFLTQEKTEISLKLTNINKKDVIAVNVAAINIEKLHDNTPAPKLTFTDETVSVALATYPLRYNTLPDVLDILVGQADNILVYLNNYREVPDFLKKYTAAQGVHYILDTASEKRAAAKFTWIKNPGYHVICDDDILYAPDHVKTIVDAVKKYRKKAIVGYHGAILPEMVKDDGQPYRKEVFHFKKSLEQDRPVHLLGTGTIGLHSDTVKNFDWDLISKYNISNDQSFAVNAKRAGIPLIVLKRDAGWMKSHPNMTYGVFDEKNLTPGANSAATALLEKHNPWPEPQFPDLNSDEE